MEKTQKSISFAALAIFFWATIPTAFKLALEESSVLPILTVASVTAVIALLIILVATGKLKLLRQTTRRDLLNSALLGLINPFVYYLILLKAYQLLPAQVAQPLNMIWPIVLVFLSVPLLKQKISAGSYLSLFISFAGVYIISSQGKPFSPGHTSIPGVALATGSSLFWALYFILNHRDKRDEAVKLITNFAFASVYLLAATAITASSHETISTKGVLASVYIGIFEMGLTFWLWLMAMKYASTNDKIGNMVYLTPFISLLFVHFILGEPVYYTTPAGLLLIIAGIIYQNRRRKTSTKESG
jgi:drug/metabolite transporter (DMT)-like permease